MATLSITGETVNATTIILLSEIHKISCTTGHRSTYNQLDVGIGFAVVLFDAAITIRTLYKSVNRCGTIGSESHQYKNVTFGNSQE
jgi:hypothetical protein